MISSVRFLGLISGFCLLITGSLAKYDPISSAISVKNKLGYGSKCDHNTEVHRQRLEKEILDMEMKAVTAMQDWAVNAQGGQGQGGPIRQPPDSTALRRELASLAGDFCNQTLFLTCNAAGTCDCADDVFITGIQAGFRREGNVCVVKDGYPCIPEITTGKSSDLKCASTSKCLVKDKPDLCTKQIYAAAIASAAKPQIQEGTDGKGMSINLDLGAVLKMTTKENALCLCNGATSLGFSLAVLLTTSVGFVRWI